MINHLIRFVSLKSLIIAFLLVLCIMFQLCALLSDFCILSKTWSYMIMRNKTKALSSWNLIHFEFIKKKKWKSFLNLKELFNTYTTPPPMIFPFYPSYIVSLSKCLLMFHYRPSSHPACGHISRGKNVCVKWNDISNDGWKLNSFICIIWNILVFRFNLLLIY